jgi:hypothetical protein
VFRPNNHRNTIRLQSFDNSFGDLRGHPLLQLGTMRHNFYNTG